ncbi:MAG: Ig-like domain-containing protein, partial [Mucinivorans sp.]
PYIVSVFPANNSNIKGCNFSEIRVTFSQPMSPYAYSVGVVKDDASFSRIPRSETIDAYWVDNYTFVIPIEPSLIENDKKYGILLGRRGFGTLVSSKMKEDYIITYKTCE